MVANARFNGAGKGVQQIDLRLVVVVNVEQMRMHAVFRYGFPHKPNTMCVLRVQQKIRRWILGVNDIQQWCKTGNFAVPKPDDYSSTAKIRDSGKIGGDINVSFVHLRQIFNFKYAGSVHKMILSDYGYLLV